MTLNELDTYIKAYLKRKKDESYLSNSRTAQICCVLANLSSKKRYKVKDFMPKENNVKMNPQQFVTTLKAITIAFGGEIVA